MLASQKARMYRLLVSHIVSREFVRIRRESSAVLLQIAAGAD